MENANGPFVIVVGVDFSDLGDAAFDQALKLSALRSPSELHIVHIMAPYAPSGELAVPTTAGALGGATLSEVFARLQDYAATKLREFKAKQVELGREPITRANSHVRVGEAPSHEIAQLASDLEADLVVVGTHGRRGLSRLLLGSVAESLVRVAPCAVLVVRPKGDMSREPTIEPPCPNCIQTRRATAGAELWCEHHRARHSAPHALHRSGELFVETGYSTSRH